MRRVRAGNALSRPKKALRSSGGARSMAVAGMGGGGLVLHAVADKAARATTTVRYIGDSPGRGREARNHVDEAICDPVETRRKSRSRIVAGPLEFVSPA